MKKITITCVLFFSTLMAFAQTSLTTGDIAFIGVNTDGATDADDSFAFVLLKDIDANTTITFTDRGWNDGTGFFEAVGDGEFTWTSGTARSAGDVVVLDFSNLQPLAAAFTVLGDQLFAIQGSVASPTFIAGLHFNVVTGTTDDANWDGAATSNTTSALPDALTTGDTAIRLSGPDGIEQDNFQFSCATATCPLAGTAEEIRTIVHNLSNWVSNNDTPFSGTVDTNFGTPAVGPQCTINIDAQPNNVSICQFNTISTSMTVTASGNGEISYLWEVLLPGSGTWSEIEANANGSAQLNFTTVDILDSGTQYRVTVSSDNNTPNDDTDDCSVTSNIANLTVNPLPDVTFTAPADLCINGGIQAGLGGGTAIGGVYSGPGVTDDGNGMTYTFDPAAAGVGTHTITYDYTDTNGCTNSASDDVEVFALPVVTLTAPADIIITAGVQAGLGGGTPTGGVYAGPGVTDDGNGMTFSFDPAVAGVGVHKLTYTFTNANGCSNFNSDDIEVIQDNIPPVIDCASVDGARNNDAGQCGFTMLGTGFDPTATDNIGVLSLTNDFNNTSSLAGETFPVGITTVIWNAVDAAGNLGSCSLAIVITDNEAPTAIVQNVTLELDDQGQVSSNVFSSGALISSDDNCGLAVGVGVTGPNTFTCANIGENKQRIFVRDIHGNQTPYDVVVTVTDPLGICVNITCPPDITIQEGESTDPSATGAATSTGGIVDVAITFLDIIAADGVITRTWTGTDSNNNSSSCDQIITVLPVCEVTIVQQPQNAEICAGDPLSFDVGATGTGTLSYQWQVDTGTGFEDLGAPSANSQLNFAYMEIGGGGNQYRVIVTSDNNTPNDDTDDCTTTSEAATLTVNRAPIVEITGDESYCYDGNGVVLDAGAGYSSYLWSPGGETTQTISVTEGSYTVEVTNEFGCKNLSEPFMVTNNQPLVCNILQDVLTTDHETTDGVATVNVTGGTDQFTYLWDNGETTQTATTLTYGMHSVTVTDSNGCETNCQIDIAKELYCWTNLVQNVSVRGGNDGKARVYGHGGYRPFTFLWDDGSTKELNTGLTVGTHYVTITDATGATSQCSVTITEPNTGNCNDFTTSIEQEKLTTDHETTDGIATVYPKGGTGQYTYLWDNGETTQTATTITYGMHSVTVTDAAGCISIAQIDIAKELYCWINLYGNVSIHGAKDGSAMVHGNGGYRPHTFKWGDGSTAQLNNNLGAGTHYVTVTDATGATSQCSVIISEPNQEVCDGIDNDGDGKVDEGFDQDGDGIADCFDICNQGDDHVDIDFDGIPDECDDNVCVKDEAPMTACYQTAVWDQQTCRWIISGERPFAPVTECYQTAEWNGTTCTWEILDGQPEMPMTLCYQTAVWSDQICDWEIKGEKPLEPMTECFQTAIFNEVTCIWDIFDGQPEMPITECYQMAEWNELTCSWDITGEQPEIPVTLCYQTAVWNDQICDWEINGEKPLEPVTECFQTAVFNEVTCTWDIFDGQPEMPITECYQMAEWNDLTCSWDVTGEQPEMPMTLCYETAVWNEVTCEWDVTGVQPDIPITACNETAVWNELTCDWDIIENNNDCGSGTIDQCETAFARSANEDVSSCFLDILNVSGNRWGWTNEFPSTNGTYNMDLYAAAGQCTISNGVLVGNVEVIYTNGTVNVTVSTLPGYKMTVAQLYVGTEILPTGNNGRFTTAPGQYPYSDTVEGDFNTFTFESVNVGNSGSFYVVLHANVCPNVTVPKKAATTNVDLTAYPIPFKNEINLKIESPRKMTGKLSIYDAIGQKVQDFGIFDLKEGENEIKLYVNELPVGMYFIHMSSDYGKDILKILGK